MFTVTASKIDRHPIGIGECLVWDDIQSRQLHSAANYSPQAVNFLFQALSLVTLLHFIVLSR